MTVVVRNLSPAGAKLTALTGSGLNEATPLALTTYRRGWWRMGRRQAVRTTGRVIRVVPAGEGKIEAAVRFDTPTTIR